VDRISLDVAISYFTFLARNIHQRALLCMLGRPRKLISYVGAKAHMNCHEISSSLSLIITKSFNSTVIHLYVADGLPESSDDEEPINQVCSRTLIILNVCPSSYESTRAPLHMHESIAEGYQ
jgi:hypothetical protein